MDNIIKDAVGDLEMEENCHPGALSDFPRFNKYNTSAFDRNEVFRKGLSRYFFFSLFEMVII